MEKMTIHRALAELKLIDSRIEKSINTILCSGVYQEDKLINNYYKKEDFEKDAKAKYQSVKDMIDRKNKIKSAIVKANGVTKVKITDQEMTIADAINLKGVIDFKKKLIYHLLNVHNKAKANAEINNNKVDENALKLAQAALQKDNVKINDGDAVAITEPFIKKNKFHVFDPLNIEKLTEEMQKEVDDFDTEVDAVLSEANAITVIEI